MENKTTCGAPIAYFWFLLFTVRGLGLPILCMCVALVKHMLQPWPCADDEKRGDDYVVWMYVCVSVAAPTWIHFTLFLHLLSSS